MKSGSELVRLGLRTFFENAAEDLEKTLENLKLGKFTHSRSQMKGVSQNINYTTVALLPILTALFEHITQHHFGVDLLRESRAVAGIRPRRRCPSWLQLFTVRIKASVVSLIIDVLQNKRKELRIFWKGLKTQHQTVDLTSNYSYLIIIM